MTRLFAPRVGFGFLLACACGCGSGVETPAQQFILDQQAIETPMGTIETSSVRDIEGVIEYETSDGSRWNVSWKLRPDGTPDYGTPERVGADGT